MNPIPAFEGHPVEGTTVKMSGAVATDELTDVVIGIDDVVQMVSQFRCIDVRHKVDPKTGLIIREQVLRPIEMALLPIDPNNPDDDGIIRALPGPIRSGDDQ